jgi:threonine dehydrogenase-like Zn-dependent dehydrogenase
LIIGCGIIGLLWYLTLKHFGLSNITAAEPNARRLQIAKDLGVHGIPPERLLTLKTVFDVIIDCSGNTKAIEQAVPLLRPLGKFLFFGICPQDDQIQISPFKIFQKELTLIGSVINPFTFSRAADLIQQIQVPAKKLGIVTFPLDQFREALKTAQSGSVSKVFFKPGNYHENR